MNVLSLEPYKLLRAQRLRGRRDAQDAQLDEQSLALRELQSAKKAKQDEFVSRAAASRAEAQAAREAAGDFSTPLQRIRSRVTAEAVIENAAAKSK